MTFLLSSATALFNQITTWTNRANQAWGASRVWNSGTSFETDVATWTARANNAWGASRVWNTGSSFETDSATWNARANNAWGASRVWSSGVSFETDRNAAYDSGVWGSGNLWSTDAHGDPNVWTNRYNAGVTDANNALPAAPGDAISGTVIGTTFSNTQGALMRVTTDRAGYWMVAWNGTATQPSNTSGDHVDWALYQGAGVIASQQVFWDNTKVGGGVFIGPTFMAAGTVLEIRATKTGTSTMTMATQAMTATFIPTPANPH